MRRCTDDRSGPVSVLVLSHTAQPSGGELAMLNLMRAAAGRVDFRLVVAEDGPFAARSRKLGVPVVVLPWPGAARNAERTAVGPNFATVSRLLSLVRYALQTARLIRTERPDVVHANGLKSALYGGLAALLTSTPMVWHLRDRVAADYLGRASTVLIRACLALLPNAIIVDSVTVERTVGRLARLKVRVAPSGIRVDDFAGVRQRAGRAPLVIGAIGRLAPWKGQRTLIEALGSLDGDWTARIAGTALFGEDDYAAELTRSVVDADLAARIAFVGQIADVPEFLQQVDILVHTSVLAEPFGQVVVEGMAAGLPVIATDIGGPAETIVHGQTGLLVPPADSAALLGALVALRDDELLRRRLGDAARLAARNLDVSFTVDAVAALYAELIDDPKRHRRRPALSRPREAPGTAT